VVGFALRWAVDRLADVFFLDPAEVLRAMWVSPVLAKEKKTPGAGFDFWRPASIQGAARRAAKVLSG
jgi:hypothetical protein